MTKPVRYDLSGLEPAERAMVASALEEADIIHAIDDSVLSVARACETDVDEILALVEEWGKQARAQSVRANAVIDGSTDPNDLDCENCGDSPAASIVLRTFRGMVLVNAHGQLERILCSSCAELVCKEIQKGNLKKGWTSVTGLWMNPIILSTNQSKLAAHRHKLTKARDSHG